MALACPTPEPAVPLPITQVALGIYRSIDEWVDVVLSEDHPMVYVFGSERPALPTEPRTDGPITYDVWVDPIYDESCFEDHVDETLSDPRSWPGVRKVLPGETPQYWITLTAPAGACGTRGNPRASCTRNETAGTGIITINAMRWSRGYGDLSHDRTQIINHEVGHILRAGHANCSVMGAPRWTPAAGYPKYETQWTECTKVPSWPTESERISVTKPQVSFR